MRFRIADDLAQLVHYMLGRRHVRVAHSQVNNVKPALTRAHPQTVYARKDIFRQVGQLVGFYVWFAGNRHFVSR